MPSHSNRSETAAVWTETGINKFRMLRREKYFFQLPQNAQFYSAIFLSVLRRWRGIKRTNEGGGGGEAIFLFV